MITTTKLKIVTENYPLSHCKENIRTKITPIHGEPFEPGWILIYIEGVSNQAPIKLGWNDPDTKKFNSWGNSFIPQKGVCSCTIYLPSTISSIFLDSRQPLSNITINQISNIRAFFSVTVSMWSKSIHQIESIPHLLRIFSLLFQILRKEGTDPLKKAFHMFLKTGDISEPKRFLRSRFLLSISERPAQSLKSKSVVDSSIHSTSEIETDPRIIAFYLPQFHPIPLNDLHWGKGFTEWRNVAKSSPAYEGHHQPRQPGELGFYDLRLPIIQQQQADLAMQYGISGFCYYYYWFQGTRLLNLPIDQLLASKQPNFPFCFCWANETWTKRWDLNKNVMIAQTHSPEDDLNFIRHLLPTFQDPRYIRIHDKPLLLVYRTELFPNPLETTQRWRTEVQKAGFKDLYLIRCEGYESYTNPENIGFDASYNVPALFLPSHLLYEHTDKLHLNQNFRGKIFDYRKIIDFYSSEEHPDYKKYDDIMLAFDNTPRYKDRAVIFHGATPALYEKWLTHSINRTKNRFSGEERLIFINAWNEWGEGSYLEPDLLHGRAFLEATKSAVEKTRIHPASYQPL